MVGWAVRDGQALEDKEEEEGREKEEGTEAFLPGCCCQLPADAMWLCSSPPRALATSGPDGLCRGWTLPGAGSQSSCRH
jgi:hypothetical protein